MTRTTEEWESFMHLQADADGREAVAEVIRLRRELERTRAGLQDALDLLGHVESRVPGSLANRVGRGYTRTHLKRITNILNGEPNGNS